jgi:hypothetical protein
VRTSEQALAALRCTRIVHAYPDFLMSCRQPLLATFMASLAVFSRFST